MTLKSHKRILLSVIFFLLLFSILPFTSSVMRIDESFAARKKKSDKPLTEEEKRALKDEDRLKANAKSDTKIIYPADYMIIYEQRDWLAGVVKIADDETAKLELIEGENGDVIEAEQIELEDNGMFMYPVEYSPGINTIIINDAKISVYYQEDEEDTPPVFYKEMHVHQSVPDLCQECHDIFESEKRDFPLNSESLIDICENCHKSRIYNRLRKIYTNVHAPVAEGKCQTCHSMHISPNEHMLKKPQSELCSDCHNNFIKKVKKNKFIHLGDMFDSICTKCHNPHSSNIKGLVRDVRKGICKTCHQIFSGEKKDIKYKSIHKPVVQGKCYECHDIHAGQNKMYLIKESSKETCIVCHDTKLSSGHGKKLENCTECHNAHISDKEGLFTERGIKKCLECHKDLNYRKDISAKSNCQSCHTPHSNENVEMAKTSCINCHEKNKLTLAHSDMTPPYEKCTDCHAMHSSGTEKLLKPNSHPLEPLKEKRCKACHTSKSPETAKAACVDCHKGVYDAKHPQTVRPTNTCIRCHKVHGGGTIKMLPDFKHKPFAEGKCEVCHSSIDESILLPDKAASGELCLSCHKDIDLDLEKQKDVVLIKAPEEAKKPPTPQRRGRGPTPVKEEETKEPEAPKKKAEPYVNTHKPFENRECTKCHETHASEYNHLVLKQGSDLCYKCHKSKETNELGEPMFSIHQPINAGDCLSCHYPHGSKIEKLLHNPGEELCFKCHENFLRNKESMPQAKGGLAAKAKAPMYKVIHKPILEEGCLACHSPHSSMSKKLLVSKKDGVFICFGCHENFVLDDEGIRKKSVHKPVLEGKCSSCHETHANDNPKLLLEVEQVKLCQGCHNISKHHRIDKGSLERMVTIPKEFIMNKQKQIICTNCHNPHASNVERLFVDKKKVLCLKCHSSVPG
ncbi:cytochrome c3 family protein [Thermodesulfobacteriota bacterium]